MAVRIHQLLSEPITGNLIGLLSLLIGMVSLILTIYTFQKATRIEKQINDVKARTLNKRSFGEYRNNTIKTLKRDQKVVIKAEQISKEYCNSLYSQCLKTKEYSQELLHEDHLRIESFCKQLKPLIEDSNLLKEKGQTIYFEVSTGLISILEKGDYAI